MKPVNSKEEAIERMCGKPGEPVPAVDVEDIKAVWALAQDVKKRHPLGGVAIGVNLYESVCTPSADIRAVLHRLGMLGFVEFLLEAAYPGGQWTEAAFRTAAKMELIWPPVDIPHFPLDVVEFLAQARAKSA
jgi:hypothetical protein